MIDRQKRALFDPDDTFGKDPEASSPAPPMDEVWRKLEDAYPGKSFAERREMFERRFPNEGHGGTAPLWVGWATTLP